MNPVQKQRFDETREVDLAYGIAGLGRFRVNVFQQRGTMGIVFRVIPFGVKTIEQLHLPKVIESIAMEQRGLVLVTGTTGSGKSTSLASLVPEEGQTVGGGQLVQAQVEDAREVVQAVTAGE